MIATALYSSTFYMNRKDILEAHEKMIISFLTMHHGKTSKLVTKAGMESEFNFYQDFDLSIDNHFSEE